MTRQERDENVAEREIVSTRVFDVSRESVYGAFSDPTQLAVWWGLKGFTNSIGTFER